jgi:hypothetical protein
MKIRAKKKGRKVRNYSFIVDLKDYRGLTREEFDVALNGVPYEGKRYPLSYVFWGEECHRPVLVTLTGEAGTLIGENLNLVQSQHLKGENRAIVKIGERITDLAYSVLRVQ